jgi:CheY-like chemotaxis protein
VKVKSIEKKPRILVVDNDIRWRQIYETILAAQGYDIKLASSYDEAKLLLAISSFDLAIVDISIDEFDDNDSSGFQIMDEINKAKGKTTSTIIVTRRALTHDLVKKVFREYKVLDLIEKKTSSGGNFDIEEFLKIVEQGIQKSQMEPSKNDVSFTAFYPREGQIDEWHSLLVYIHLVSALEEVHRDVKRFRDQLPSPREISSSQSASLVRGTDITIIPSCEGITFNPPQITIKWMEDYHGAYFRFRAENSLSNDAAKGYITFFVGPVIVGMLKFAMFFNDKTNASLLNQEAFATMYHSDKIFVSYSHKDSDIVLAFKKVHEATGYDVLIDIDNLRSGQEWNPELMRLIDRADIFQLFWSENSKKSKYCKQEWEHALNRATEGFIRPVYWHKPIPNPPKELSKYHFEYVDLHDFRV